MYNIKALYEAKSTREAIRLLEEHREARIIAGGSDVLLKVRDGKLSGIELVSIHGIDSLRGVSLEDNGTIRIGALTSFSHLSKNTVIRENIPVLAESADEVGSPQIRNVGTIGGNICNGSPAADTPPTLFAWDAQVELAGPEGIRRVPIQELYIKAGAVQLKRAEMLTAILIPEKAWKGYAGRYIKYAMREALDISVVSCSVNVRLSSDKKVMEDVRAAFGAVGPVPLRVPSAEAAVRGKEINIQTIKTFAEETLKDIQPWDDWRTSKEFRAHIAKKLAVRALTEAVRIRGGLIDE